MQQQMPITYLSASPSLQKLAEDSYEAGQHLYFIYSRDHNAVKIGVARHPNKRLQALQAANPTPLQMIYVLPYGGYKLETRLHKEFANLRTRGEWFKYTAPIKEFINQLDKITKEVGLQWDLKTHQLQS